MIYTGMAILFFAVSSSLGLPPGLLSAICYIESHHKENAINKHDGGSASYGACQIKLATAKSIGYTGTAKQLMRADVNVMWAGKYLKWQLKRYNNDPRKAVAAYNAGSHKLNRKGFTRNNKYVIKVFKAWGEYR